MVFAAGALYSLNGQVTFDGDTIFANNSVRYHGGEKRRMPTNFQKQALS